MWGKANLPRDTQGKSNTMEQTSITRRVLTAVAMAILWLVGAADGWAAEAPTGSAYTNSLGMEFVRFEPGTFTMGVGTHLCFMDRRKDIGHESGMFFFA